MALTSNSFQSQVDNLPFFKPISSEATFSTGNRGIAIQCRSGSGAFSFSVHVACDCLVSRSASKHGAVFCVSKHQRSRFTFWYNRSRPHGVSGYAVPEAVVLVPFILMVQSSQAKDQLDVLLLTV